MSGTLNAALSEGTTLLYDSGSVGAGAAITSPMLDVRRFGQLAIIVNNADAGTRNLNFSLYAPNVATAIGTGLIVAASGGNVWQIVTWGGGWASGTGFSGFPPGFVGVTLAAGGATTARVIVWGR